MELSPEQIAAAHARGFHLFPASPDQVGRLSMQRRIFYVAGEPKLVTRDGAFFETEGTLLNLLEGLGQPDGAARRSDGRSDGPPDETSIGNLAEASANPAAGQPAEPSAAAAPAASTPEPAAEPRPGQPAAAAVRDASATPAPAEAPAAAAHQAEAASALPDPAVPDPALPDLALPAPASAQPAIDPDAGSSAPAPAAATAAPKRRARAPRAPATPAPAAEPAAEPSRLFLQLPENSDPLLALRTALAALPGGGRSRPKRQPRWLTAGAGRRGRAGVHWSARRR